LSYYSAVSNFTTIYRRLQAFQAHLGVLDIYKHDPSGLCGQLDHQKAENKEGESHQLI
jgi:hypothetical protein